MKREAVNEIDRVACCSIEEIHIRREFGIERKDGATGVDGREADFLARFDDCTLGRVDLEIAGVFASSRIRGETMIARHKLDKGRARAGTTVTALRVGRTRVDGDKVGELGVGRKKQFDALGTLECHLESGDASFAAGRLLAHSRRRRRLDAVARLLASRHGGRNVFRARVDTFIEVLNDAYGVVALEKASESAALPDTTQMEAIAGIRFLALGSRRRRQ